MSVSRRWFGIRNDFSIPRTSIDFARCADSGTASIEPVVRCFERSCVGSVEVVIESVTIGRV